MDIFVLQWWALVAQQQKHKYMDAVENKNAILKSEANSNTIKQLETMSIDYNILTSKTLDGQKCEW